MTGGEQRVHKAIKIAIAGEAEIELAEKLEQAIRLRLTFFILQRFAQVAGWEKARHPVSFLPGLAR